MLAWISLPLVGLSTGQVTNWMYPIPQPVVTPWACLLPLQKYPIPFVSPSLDWFAWLGLTWSALARHGRAALPTKPGRVWPDRACSGTDLTADRNEDSDKQRYGIWTKLQKKTRLEALTIPPSCCPCIRSLDLAYIVDFVIRLALCLITKDIQFHL